MKSLVAYLGGRAPVETYKLFPSDESTQFGDWVKAGALKAGDQLSVRLGIDAVAGDQTVTVKSTTQTHTPHRVYNLEINSQNNQITHNYFVGKNELWVHNGSRFGKFGSVLRFVMELSSGEISPQKDCDIRNVPPAITSPLNPKRKEFSSYGGRLPSPKYGPYGSKPNPYNQ